MNTLNTRPSMLTIIAATPRAQSPFTSPTIPNMTPRGPRRTGIRTMARTPQIIPAMDQLLPGRRPGVAFSGAYEGRGSVNPSPLVTGEGMVRGWNAGDEALARGQPEEDGGHAEDDGRGRETSC